MSAKVQIYLTCSIMRGKGFDSITTKGERGEVPTIIKMGLFAMMHPPSLKCEVSYSEHNRGNKT